MKTPMIVASSGKMYSADEAKVAADVGFTHVCYSCCTGDEWKRSADNLHAAGLKVAAWLPPWYSVPVNDAHRLRTLAGGVDVSPAPSFWYPEDDVAALEFAEKEGVVPYLDAVLCDALGHDCPFPTAWVGCEAHDFRYTREFWSGDEAAQAAWAEFSDGKEMPVVAGMGMDGLPVVNMEFYQWYRMGWWRRIESTTAWAMDHGIKDVWTWMIPHNHWSAENVAMGVAGSWPLYAAWAEGVKLRDGNPAVVVACLWQTYEAFRSTCVANVETFIAEAGVDTIIGAESCHSPQTVPTHFERWGPKGRAMGSAGIFASDGFLFGGGHERMVREAFTRERGLWDAEMERRHATE